MDPADHPAFSIDDLELGHIEAGRFTHEAHVYLAWLYIETYGITEAIERFTAALRRLTLKLGVPGKYHQTISWFFMLLIAERRAWAPGQDWTGFRAANADLLSRDDNILRRYYTDDVLKSDIARRTFVLPDRRVA